MQIHLTLRAAEGGGGTSAEGSEKELTCSGFDEATGAATGCHAHEQHNPILPEPSEIVWGVISFALLLGLMWKFALPAVKNAMDARAQRIRDDLDQAEAAKGQAEQVLHQYERQLADAKAESNRIIEEARAQAQRVKDDIVASASTEVNEMRTRATADIEAARASALASLQGSVGTIAIELAEKVVERNLDRETNQRLVESFIAQVGSR